MQLGRQAVGAVDDVEDAAAVVVEQHDAQVGRHVAVPQPVAVVEEAQVADDQGGQVVAGQGRAHGRADCAVDAAGPAVAVDAAERRARRVADQVRVADGHAVAHLQAAAGRQGLHDALRGLEFAKAGGLQEVLERLARLTASSRCQAAA